MRNLSEFIPIISGITNKIILEKFDNLTHGDHLSIIYDHDPVSLYFDFLKYRNDLFEWKYLEAGPDVWMVQIKNIGSDYRTIRELMQEYPKAKLVFEDLNIDFAKNEGRLFTEACKEASVDPIVVIEKIEGEIHSSSLYKKADNWPLDFLIDYILINHHQFIKEEKPVIIKLLHKVQNLHGEVHPELYNLNLIFNKITEKLMLHLQKEEELIFPTIKQLLHQPEKLDQQTYVYLEGLLKRLASEHDKIAEAFSAIRKITASYSLYDAECDDYRMLYSKLKEFETDLNLHAHLEHSILFAKILALKKNKESVSYTSFN